MLSEIIKQYNIYILPPLMSLIIGLTLAVISLVKGKFRAENIMFSILCLWWTLLAPAFIMQFIYSGDKEKILSIERFIHFFYVYLPPINLMYFQSAFKVKLNRLTLSWLIISFILSLTTFTDLYFYDIYTYSWGYIAKGGIAFQVFGVYCFAGFGYFIYFQLKQLKAASNVIEKMKLKYVVFSFFLISFLTLLNIPAINGIPLYPFGNFMFIPLGFMAYGVLKYQLMDIKSLLYMTLMWGVISSAILIPNIIAFILLYPYLSGIPATFLFMIIFFWFIMNFLYLKIIQPWINQLFNKKKINLIRAETQFVEKISLLKNLDDLSLELKDAMKKAFGFGHAHFFIKSSGSNTFSDSHGRDFAMDLDIKDWFLGSNHLVERNMVESNPYYTFIRDKLLALFNELECDYIIPFIKDFEILGVLILPEKPNQRQITPVEIRFINNIRATASISLTNSMMFQHLTDLKNNLQYKVLERTEELLRAMEKLENTNANLLEVNRSLETANRIAERDMNMAINVQTTIIPRVPASLKSWDISIAYRPMSGVSGDFYDFYETNGVLHGVSVMDVSGHGIASGLITMIAKIIFQKNFSHDLRKDLNDMIRNANLELINEIGDVDNYITGIILRFSGDRIEYVNAGHPDIIIKKYDSGKTFYAFDDAQNFKGMFLGFKEMDLPFHTNFIEVSVNDLIILYTDCIIEAKNRNEEEYGKNRLLDSIQHSPSGSAEQILASILHDLSAFRGTENLKDDLTVIVMKKIQ